MNDLIERYISAVCAYFIGKKQAFVYNDLKDLLTSSITDYEELENKIIELGHPRSMAYNYGYKPFTQHIFNPKKIHQFEKVFFSISFLYLFLSTLYYLQQLNALPFINTDLTSEYLKATPIIHWILTKPIFIFSCMSIIIFLLFLLQEKKELVAQSYDLNWTKKELDKLSHPSTYPNHNADLKIITVFSAFFIIYTLLFSSNAIFQIDHLSFSLIDLISNFFQPFMMTIFLTYVLDLTKKHYSRRYLKYCIFICFITIIGLSIFVINTQFMSNYLLPASESIIYFIINAFNIIAIILLYISASYKFIISIKFYKDLYRN